MKITRKDIIAYRCLAAEKWHDEIWHDAMVTDKNQAIGYAESIKEPEDKYTDIAREAGKFVEWNKNYNF